MFKKVLTPTPGIGIMDTSSIFIMPNPHRERATIAIKKASSLLKKIQSMIDSGAYCIDVMQQNLAAIGLLKSAHRSLMESHLDSCVLTALESSSPAKKRQMIEEILTVSKLANK
jgi:DNA-binding FrmR family transcriptional regulator